MLGHLPDLYMQVVLARDAAGSWSTPAFFVGDDLETYLAAARQSREQNITVFDEPVKKIVCVMQGDEFFSTWVANKSIYRTRMALADGGELLVIAPGLKRFGEQPDVDAIIRKYGYAGTPQVLEQYRTNADMQDLAHATAHLMHGTSEGRLHRHLRPGAHDAGRDRKRELPVCRYRRNDRPIPARRPPRRLAHLARRRAVLLHSHALRRPVGDEGEAVRAASQALLRGIRPKDKYMARAYEFE